MNDIQAAGLKLASLILDPEELAAAARRTLLTNMASQAICRLHGPPDGCHCKGDDRLCHAHVVGWQEEARAVVLKFEQAGVLK
jgi:hypothetical protein